MIVDDFIEGIILIVTGEPEVWSIAFLSILVSTSAVALASVLGIPIGIYLGRSQFGNGVLFTSALNTLMGLPPVVVGLVVFLLLAAEGPLGSLNLVFSPMAMVIAQFVLTLPIVVGLTKLAVNEIPNDMPEFLQSMGVNDAQIRILLWQEAKTGILIGVITALGRAFSEVGAILIVGGNLKGYTRVLTTAIVTETSKGNYGLSLALGILLMSLSFFVTTFVTVLQRKS